MRVELFEEEKRVRVRSMAYQALGAAVLGLNLLGSKTHRQESEAPCDHRSRRGGRQALRSPDTQVMSAGQAGGESDHTSDQGDRNEGHSHNIPCTHQNHQSVTHDPAPIDHDPASKRAEPRTDLYVVVSAHVGIEVPVQDGTSQGGSDEVQTEVEHHKWRSQALADSERHCCKASYLRSKNEALKLEIDKLYKTLLVVHEIEPVAFYTGSNFFLLWTMTARACAKCREFLAMDAKSLTDSGVALYTCRHFACGVLRTPGLGILVSPSAATCDSGCR